MSQLNVDTLSSQTGTNVQLASGHTLKDKDGTAFDTQSDIKLLHSVSASNSATVDFFKSDTGWNTTDYSRFIVKARWIVPQDDDRRIYAALYYGTSLRSGTYEHAGQYYRIDGSDSGGYSQSEQTDYIELTSGTAGNRC